MGPKWNKESETRKKGLLLLKQKSIQMILTLRKGCFCCWCLLSSPISILLPLQSWTLQTCHLRKQQCTSTLSYRLGYSSHTAVGRSLAEGENAQGGWSCQHGTTEQQVYETWSCKEDHKPGLALTTPAEPQLPSAHLIFLSIRIAISSSCTEILTHQCVSKLRSII